MLSIPSILVFGATFIDVNTTAQLVNGNLTLSSTHNIGGKGYNIAKGLRLFGMQTSLGTAIGADDLGKMVLDEANKLGINLTSESKGYSHTPFACIISTKEIDNTTTTTSKTNFEKVDTSLFDKQEVGELPANISTIIVSSNCNQNILEFCKQQKELNLNLELILSISGAKAIAGVLQ